MPVFLMSCLWTSAFVVIVVVLDRLDLDLRFHERALKGRDKPDLNRPEVAARPLAAAAAVAAAVAAAAAADAAPVPEVKVLTGDQQQVFASFVEAETKSRRL